MTDIQMRPEIQMQMAQQLWGKIQPFDPQKPDEPIDMAVMPVGVHKRFHVMLCVFRKDQTAAGPTLTFHTFGPIKSFLTERQANEYAKKLGADTTLVPDRWKTAVLETISSNLAVEVLGGAN